MAKIIADRVVEVSTTVGVGSYTLLGALVGFRPVASVCSDGDTFDYFAEQIDGSGLLTGDWETGLGTWSGGTLARTTIYASSNAGSAVSWTTGSKRIALAITAGAISSIVADREPAVAPGSALQYWRGDKSWTDFYSSVRAATLTGLSTVSSAVIGAADTVLLALGKLQKKITDNLGSLTAHAGSTANPHGVTKAQVGLGNADDTRDADKPVSTAQAAADTAAFNAAKSYADGLVVGLWDDRGGFDASVNTFPTSGGSGTSGAILKGDIWTISIAATAGVLLGFAVGSTVRAVADSPGQTVGNWSSAAVGLGYVPENLAKKDASGGYAGLTLFKLNLRNAGNSTTSWFTTAATVARTWTMPDKDGTVAMLSDIAVGTGTVSSVSVVTVNGFAGSVANATTTPAITLSVSASGILKGAGGVLASAIAGTDYVSPSSTETQTNKRITARVGSTTSSATPTINTDNVDVYKLTAQAVDITSMSTNLTGTPADNDCLIIEITGTSARAVTWGASFEASTVALPTTTVGTAMLAVAFLWNTATSKWRCVASV